MRKLQVYRQSIDNEKNLSQEEQDKIEVGEVPDESSVSMSVSVEPSSQNNDIFIEEEQKDMSMSSSVPNFESNDRQPFVRIK